MLSRLRQLFPALFLTAVTACASRSGPASAPDTPISAAPTPSAPIASGISRWSFNRDPRQHQYQLTNIATVRMEVDTATRQDTITAAVRFSISIAGDIPQVISGEITQLSISVRSRTGSTQSSAPLPIHFEGHRNLNDAEIHTSSPTGTTIPCADSTSPHLASLYNQLNSIPQTVSKGDTWRDSLLVQSCQGVIPVEVRSVQHYHVIGETKIGDQPVVLIQRSDSTESTGEGSQGQHRVAVNGSGTADTQLYIDPTAGFLITSESRRRTTFTIEASGQRRQFTQRSTEVLRRIP